MNLGSENETTEFKSSIGQLDKGLTALTAMLNRSNHGTVYFGVDDDGTVIGMEITDTTYEKIRNAVRNDILPRIIVSMEPVESDDGKRCLKVEATGFDIPYSYKERYFIRHGASNESASPDILTKLVLSRGFDSMRELESHRTDLHFRVLNDMMVSRDLHPRHDRGYLDSLGLLTRSGGYNLNAEILADDNGLVMQIVEFNGTTRTNFLKRTDFGNQCMFMAMNMVLDNIRARNETVVDTSSGIRTDTHLFDFQCFREAWMNACIHNSWRTGIPPIVAIFDDRIEVQSNGSIPYGMPLEDFYSGRSAPVNESLFRLAMALGLTEHTGRGVPTITERYGRDAIRVTDGSVTVTIPFSFEPSSVFYRRSLKIRDDAFDDRERAVLEYVREHESAKIQEISDAVGVSSSAVKRTLASLKSKGVLENRGTTRNSRWVVI